MVKQLYIDVKEGFLSALHYEVKESKGCAIFVHGYSNWKDERDFIYCRMAKAFQQNGIESVLFDMRGHGESSHNLEDVNYGDLVQDIKTVVDYVRGNINNKHFFVTSGFSARIALDADDNTSLAFCMLSPMINMPDGLRCMTDFDGDTYFDALNKVGGELENDLEKMGMLTKFVVGEIVNASIFMTSNIARLSEKKNCLCLLAKECNYDNLEVLGDSKIVNIDEGGVMFRSPKAVQQIIEVCISYISDVVAGTMLIY